MLTVACSNKLILQQTSDSNFSSVGQFTARKAGLLIGNGSCLVVFGFGSVEGNNGIPKAPTICRRLQQLVRTI